MTLTTLALTTSDAPGLALKVFAILGGVLVGGLFVGFLARVLTRLLTTRPMPTWAVRFMRLLGGVAGGWLVALVVFGGAGTGIGGPGGSWFGERGKGGSEEAKDSHKEDEPKEVKKDRDKDPGEGDGTLLRVAVLGPDPLKVLQGKEPVDTKRCYTIEREKPRELYDLEALQRVLRQRHVKIPELKVIVVIYTDSPSQGNRLVAAFQKWLEAEEMFKTWDLPPKDAPR